MSDFSPFPLGNVPGFLHSAIWAMTPTPAQHGILHGRLPCRCEVRIDPEAILYGVPGGACAFLEYIHALLARHECPPFDEARARRRAACEVAEC